MKKSILIVLFMMVLGSCVVYAANVTKMPIEDWYNLRITLVNQEPDPVEPGKYVDVRFKIENRGSKNAEDVILELLPEFPFSIDKESDAIKKIGSVHGRQIGNLGVIVKYKIRVDENAVEGENILKLRFRVKNSEWVELDDFEINIRTEDALLVISSINPERIVQGIVTPVTIGFKNLGDSWLRNIQAKLKLGGIPIAPVDSSNEEAIRELMGKTEKNLTFKLVAEGDADSNIYKIPLEINYLDNVGTKYGKNISIGLIVGGIPDLSVIIDSTTIYSSGKKGTVTVKFVNKGATDIKFLNVKLMKSNGYGILSSDEVYIGNVDSDDYETADFDLFVKKTKANKINLPLGISYSDANNKEYNEEIKLALQLYSASEAKKYGFVKGDSKIGIVIIIVIVVGGFLIYRRRKKKKGKGADEGFKLKLPFFKKK